MLNKFLNIQEALIFLNDGLLVKDTYSTLFKLKNEKILIKSENVSCSLSLKEFKELYKNSKFILVEDNDELIDLKKDEEYYSFKHK